MDVEQRELSTKWSLAPGNIQYSTVGLENNVLTLFCPAGLITPEFKFADIITLGGCSSGGRGGWWFDPHPVLLPHVKVSSGRTLNPGFLLASAFLVGFCIKKI